MVNSVSKAVFIKIFRSLTLHGSQDEHQNDEHCDKCQLDRAKNIFKFSKDLCPCQI